MCHFISLIVPTDDAEAVRAVMKHHGRAAEPIDNPSIRKVLRSGEHQYLTTLGHCDCGTALVPRHETAEALEGKLAKQVMRMRRKGWSDAKIARAAEEKSRAVPKPRRSGTDSLELWNAVLHDLQNELKVPYAALFVRSYRGAINTEAFVATRREVSGVPWMETLATMMLDEVTIFR